MSTIERSLRLPPTDVSPGMARVFVRRVLTAWDHPDLIDDASLAATELVTNGFLQIGRAHV